MAFKFRTYRQPVHVGLPSLPRRIEADTEEQLMGSVDGVAASAPEERLSRALDRAGVQYIFRYTVGAPRGLPGWKELDFVVVTNGVTYLLEVDTAFTHRAKENADVLHDAIALNDTEIQSSGTVWPSVLHADGDTDLSTSEGAALYVKRFFGR